MTLRFTLQRAVGYPTFTPEITATLRLAALIRIDVEIWTATTPSTLHTGIPTGGKDGPTPKLKVLPKDTRQEAHQETHQEIFETPTTLGDNIRTTIAGSDPSTSTMMTLGFPPSHQNYLE